MPKPTSAWTTCPRQAEVPPPAYLCCALRLRCGDPAQHKLPNSNSSSGSEAHGRKVSPREWPSFRRTPFFYTFRPRSSDRQRIGYKDRLCRQTPDLGFCCCCRGSDLSLFGLVVRSVVRPEKMRSSTQPRSFAGFSVVFLLFLRLQRGSGADTRTCPSRCACSGELLDCSRLKRGQIPETIPEWTVQLWVRLKSLLSALLQSWMACFYLIMFELACWSLWYILSHLSAK